jgi:hypothetical protein
MKNKDVKEIEVIEAVPINVLETIKVSALIDVSSWKEKQLKLVAENTFFEITDNKTYEAGKKHRTNVVKGRTELQNQDKLVASKFATIRKEVGTETATLIEITQPLEDQWQEEVKAWEDRKANEKKLAEEAEALRVKTINDKIEEVETSCYEIIQKMTFSEIDFAKTQLFSFFTIEFEFEEYYILFEQVKSRVELALEQKENSLTESENQRLRNEELEKENAEAKRVSYLQASRLNEILPYAAFGEGVDFTNLSGLEESVYSEILESKKALFEANAISKKEEQDKLDAENLEHEEKAKTEKEKIFEIRKSRLAEIGFNVDEERSGFFIHPDLFDGIDSEALFNLDATWFETKISDAKLGIENSKYDAKEAIFESRKNILISIGYTYDENQEYAFFLSDDWKCTKSIVEEVHESGWEEFVNDAIAHQKRIDEALAKTDAAKLKSENKARIKRLSADKYYLSGTFSKIRDVIISELTHAEFDNEETESFRKEVLLNLDNLLDECVTELEKI